MRYVYNFNPYLWLPGIVPDPRRLESTQNAIERSMTNVKLKDKIRTKKIKSK